MASFVTNLCKAIAEYLNSLAIPVDFTAERWNQAYARLEDSLQPKCYVTPLGVTQTAETRGTWLSLYDVGLTLVQTLNTPEEHEQDALISLSEEIGYALLNFRFRDSELMTINEETARVLFDEVQMETGMLFVAMMTVQFRHEHYL